MVKSPNNPNYIFEEYKGFIIASHKNNIQEKHIDNLIIIYKKEDFPEHGYFMGLDDSKSSGKRRMESHNLEDAKSYIDWLTEQGLKSSIKPKTVIPKPKKGPKL